MAQIIQRSFTSGEIAPALRSRTDLIKYSTGLALCENFLVRAQGGVYSRPGTRFVGAVFDSSKRARLIPFSFNTEQTYMLVFEDLKMRVIKDGGYVLDGGSNIFELTTTYTEAELPRLVFTQSADVMTIVHPSHDPANLSRLADNNWTLVDIDYAPTVTPPTFSGEVVKSINDVTQANPAVVNSTSHGLVTGNTVAIADVIGMVELNGRSFKVTILTSSTYQLDGEDSTLHTAYISGGTATRQNSATTIGSGFGDFEKTYTYVITAVDEAGVESLGSVETSIISESLSVTGGIRLGWSAVAGAAYYRVYKDPSTNTQVYGWIGDSNNTTFDDFNLAPITSDAPPQDRQPFDGAGNKPSAVNYYQQRQIFGNTINEPQTTYTTQSGNFQSLRTSNPTRDDDAVTFTIAARQVNEIRHIIALDALILMTSGGEWLVTEGQEKILTPATAGVRIQTYNGSSFVPPVVINDTVVYIQEKGARVRDLNYTFTNDKYTGNDLSIMSEHLFEGLNVEEMAYAAEPYGILWCVRDDGVLLGLTYQREHEVWGWHQHTTDGTYESVATITEDGRDALYVVVKREVNGSFFRYVERMEPRITNAAEDSFFVDSGLSYDGAPATIISNLDHLEGKTVAVLADGNEVLGLVVSGGAITLTRAASKVHVGLPYTPVIETLDIDTAEPGQTVKGSEVSVSKVIIEVEKSRGGFVGPKKDDGSTGEMFEIKPRFDSDGYDSIILKTFKQELFIEPQWSKGGGIRIEQRSPLPLSILSTIPQVEVGG